jgi:hypothetical protein
MPDTNDIDTSNKFMVASQGETLVFLRPLPRTMTKDDALNLAAYIVAMTCNDEKWQRTLDAISNV